MNKPRRSRKAISQRRAQRSATSAPGPSYTPSAPRRTTRVVATEPRPWFRNPLYLGLAAAAILAIAVGAYFVSQTLAAAGSTGGQPVQYSKYPDMIIDPNKTYQAVIETDKGDLSLDLYAKDAPKTVNSFVFLAREGFYNSVTFHRVIDGFMAQGGDPTGTGSGGPGYNFADEFNQHKVGTGTLAMANAGPNTNGSQFFITYAPQPHLDGKHTVFGQITSGLDVLQSLNKVQPGQRGGTPSVIKTIRITES